MSRRSKQLPDQRKPLSNKRLVIFSVALAATIIVSFLVFTNYFSNHENRFSLKAAIVDQLGREFPNPDFNETGVISTMLETVGFTVSHFREETISVEFYSKLANGEYGIIILRAHAATREGETIVDFFSSEEYSRSKYVYEQDNGLLTRGYYSWKPGKSYFAVTPKFIENLDGTFPRSIIIAMGCNSLNATCTEMAEAFIKKGAVAYVGWTGLVDPAHTDAQTIKLLRELLIENRTVRMAINALDVDPLYGSRMTYYPTQTGDLTISELKMQGKLQANISMQSMISSDNSILAMRDAEPSTREDPGYMKPSLSDRYFIRFETMAFN